MSRFVDTVRFIKLPFNYNLFSKKHSKWCRYSASFYGYSFSKYSASFNLWLTMGLKTNLSVPLGYYYVPNLTRSDNTRIINKKSFRKYAYLVQRSLTSVQSLKFLDTAFKFSLNSYSKLSSSFVLSDFCFLVQQRPYVYRTNGTSSYNLDSSISTYDSKFFYHDYKQRSQHF